MKTKLTPCGSVVSFMVGVPFLLATTFSGAAPYTGPDTTINHLFDLKQNCATIKTPYGMTVENASAALTCGGVHGALRTAYYSLNHAYFGPKSQDTAVAGGYIRYETAPLYGAQLAIGYNLQRRLDQKNGHAEVTEFKEDRDGLAEVYLTWKNDKARLTIGNQRLNLPFVGDYADFRVLPSLYQAADIQYGNGADFVRVTKINKFKSYGDDEFTKTSRQSSTIQTDGMWAIGAGKSTKLDTGSTVKGQAWFERYADYGDILYTQASIDFPKQRYTPELAIQYIAGQEQGAAKAGAVDSQIVGVQLSGQPTKTLSAKVAYDYIRPQAGTYLNGALLTPYARNTSSSTIFAQPFFTSTQDLGAGHAFMLSAENKFNPKLTVGGRYSFMDLKENSTVASRNQSEYLLYGIYNFDGQLKGLSLTNFVGVQTSPRYDHDFWQNRLTLSYRF